MFSGGVFTAAPGHWNLDDGKLDACAFDQVIVPGSNGNECGLAFCGTSGTQGLRQTGNVVSLRRGSMAFDLASTQEFVFRDGTGAKAASLQVGGINDSSGEQPGRRYFADVNQSGTAAFVADDVDPQQSSLGSGDNLLARWAVSGVRKAAVAWDGTIRTGKVGEPTAGTNNNGTFAHFGTSFYVEVDGQMSRFTVGRNGECTAVGSYRSGDSFTWAGDIDTRIDNPTADEQRRVCGGTEVDRALVQTYPHVRLEGAQLLEFQNDSGGALAEGDVVKQNGAGTLTKTATGDATDTQLTAYVVVIGGANGANVYVAKLDGGRCRARVDAATNNISAGNPLFISSKNGGRLEADPTPGGKAAQAIADKAATTDDVLLPVLAQRFYVP